jgi:hypothetical protein
MDSKGSDKKKFFILGIIILIVVFIFFFRSTSAATYTWDNGGGDGLWSTCTNWSSDVCPGAGDIATFDATSVANATIDASFGGSIYGLDVQSGYTGTITQEKDLIIGVFGFSQNDGTYKQGSSNFDINDGGFSLVAGTFTSATSTSYIERNFNVESGATFTASSSKVWVFDGGSYLDTSTFTYPGTFPGTIDITKPNGSSFFKIASGTTVAKALDLSTNYSNVLIEENGTLNIANVALGAFDLTISGTLSASSTIDLGGSFTLNSTGVFNYDGTAISVEKNYTDNGGTFDESAVTVKFYGGSNDDDTVFTYTGVFPGLVEIAKSSTVASFTLQPAATIKTITSATDGDIYIYGNLRTEGNSLSAQNIYVNNEGVLAIYAEQTLTEPILNQGSTLEYYGPGTYTSIGDYSYYIISFTAGVYNITSNISIAGDFNNYGATFNQTNGTTTLTGSYQTIAGSNTFYNLYKKATSSATLNFPQGETQTILDTMTLHGASSTARLSLTGGFQWNINPQGSRDINYLTITNGNNVSSALWNCYDFDCTDGGNNTYIYFSEPLPTYRLRGGVRLHGGTRL